MCDNIKSQGGVYAELRYALQLHTNNGMTQEDAVRAALKGLSETDLTGEMSVNGVRHHEQTVNGVTGT